MSIASSKLASLVSYPAVATGSPTTFAGAPSGSRMQQQCTLTCWISSTCLASWQVAQGPQHHHTMKSFHLSCFFIPSFTRIACLLPDITSANTMPVQQETKLKSHTDQYQCCAKPKDPGISMVLTTRNSVMANNFQKEPEPIASYVSASLVPMQQQTCKHRCLSFQQQLSKIPYWKSPARCCCSPVLSRVPNNLLIHESQCPSTCASHLSIRLPTSRPLMTFS